jgi:hypothetical protein
MPEASELLPRTDTPAEPDLEAELDLIMMLTS